MAITPKLEIKQSQSLLMTPQLKQAINLLQMSNLELSSVIEQELASNPLLEREEDFLAQDNTKEQTIDDYDSSAETTDETSPDLDIDNTFDDSGSDREGYETANDYDWQDYAKSKDRRNSTEEDYDFFEQKLSSPKTLFQHLSEQIEITFSSPKEKLIAFRLMSFLDESGYFRGDTKKIAAILHTQENNIKQVLEKLKELEPSGIFAENLSECIALQLKDKDRLDIKMQELLQNLDLLAKREYKQLQKKLNISDEDLKEMIADIKSTNPKPALEYDTQTTDYVIPDVFVRRNKYGEYIVELNSRSLPRILIDQRYYKEIKTLSEKNKEAKRYIKNQSSSANFLIRALHQRADTILRISEEIVKSQRDFFEKGIEGLKPMALKDIADAVELHESTVSRATVNKYMHTPLGIFELKYFFSAAAGSYSGDENQSTTAIKHKIKQMIENEDPKKVLSDDKISELLAREGLKVARRTVAKYRESMKIAPSSERKREKRKI